jgi:hypothetical protein
MSLLLTALMLTSYYSIIPVILGHPQIKEVPVSGIFLHPLVVGRYIGKSIYRVDIWYIVSYRYRGNFIEKFDIFFYIKLVKCMLNYKAFSASSQ